MVARRRDVWWRSESTAQAVAGSARHPLFTWRTSVGVCAGIQSAAYVASLGALQNFGESCGVGGPVVTGWQLDRTHSRSRLRVGVARVTLLAR
jgi:hypothetical protein